MRAGELILPLGPASVSLLRRTFPAIFESVVEVGSQPTPSRRHARPATVIEPQIAEFTLHALLAEKRFWAEIRYRFIMRAPDGSEITRWTVRGAGTSADVSGPERAVELALQDAAAALATSFEEVPEAVRWLRRQPIDAATAPATRQVTQTGADSSSYPLRGMYEHIVAISADPNRSPDLSAEGIDIDPLTKGGFSFLLAAENLGDRRLLIRRPEITLAFPNGATIRSVSGSHLATALTTKRMRLAYVNPPPGLGFVGAIVTIVTALPNHAASESERAEAKVYGFVYERNELNDAVLDRQERVEGYVHFHIPRNLRAVEGVTLIVPVVELDTATRYIVSIPLGSLDRRAKQMVAE
jgi:hypothetical protein